MSVNLALSPGTPGAMVKGAPSIRGIVSQQSMGNLGVAKKVKKLDADRKNSINGISAYVPARFLKKRALVKSIVESKWANLFMIIISLWSLFADDIRLAVTTKESDLIFEVVVSIIFFMFLFEIFAIIYYKDEYFSIPNWKSKRTKDNWWRTWMRRLQLGSFYFWLDCTATFSLILEVNYNLIRI